MGDRTRPFDPLHLRNHRVRICVERGTQKKGKNNSRDSVEVRHHHHIGGSQAISHAGMRLIVRSQSDTRDTANYRPLKDTATDHRCVRVTLIVLTHQLYNLTLCHVMSCNVMEKK